MKQVLLTCSRYIFIIILLNVFVLDGWGQTPGLIIKPATVDGAAVLDPNGDGYASKTSSGYGSNDYSLNETELPFTDLVRPDPVGDFIVGPYGPYGPFNDIVGAPSGVNHAIQTAVVNGNFIVRFRLDGYSPNSNTYALFIDTDGKFGFTGPNADPDATPDNPGFELEISLHTNSTVTVYNINEGKSLLLGSYPYDTNCQKSVAMSTNSGNTDYFYDFFVPLSVTGLTSTTPIRTVAVTTMNPNMAIGNNGLIDIGGAATGNNITQIFTDLINAQTPTPPGQEVLDRSVCPTINTPILTGENTVTGSSSEPNGTTIKIYVDGIFKASGTVATGIWMITVPTLNSGQIVTATATASGKGESATTCNRITVGAECLTAPYSLSVVNGEKGVGFSITTSVANTFVTLYNSSDLLVGFSGNPKSIATPGTYAIQEISGGTGQSLSPGKYYLVASSSIGCPSAKSWICNGGNGGGSITFSNSDPPTINSPVTTSTSPVTGTGITGAIIYLYKTGDIQIGTATVSSGIWSITPSNPLINCSQIYARQLESSTSKCISINSLSITVNNSLASVAPVIYGADCVPTAPLTTVSGFSVEAPGTIIQVFNASTNLQIGTNTTVLADGSWSLTGVSIPTETSIYAKATNSANCRATSVASATVTITTQASNTGLTVSTNPIIENVTTLITGTGTNGYTVNLYLDKFDLLGTATVSGGVTWSIAVNASLLTAGSTVTAKQYNGATCLSLPSPGIVVQCQAPTTSFIVTPKDPGYCEQEFGLINVSSTQAGVIYTPILSSPSTIFGYSALGTGGPITLKTYALVSDPTPIKVRATKISGLSCQSDGVSIASVTMYPSPIKTLTVSPATTAICAGSSINISISGSQSGVSYQLRNASTEANIGTAYMGNVGVLTISSGLLYSSVSIKIMAVKTYGTANCEVKLNNQVNVTVTGPVTTQSVTASPTLLCAPATASINVGTVNDGFIYKIFRSSDNTQVGSFAGNGTIQSVTSGIISATETFYVVITGSGCTDVRLQNEVTVYLSDLTVSNTQITNVSCNGGSNGAINITTTGGISTPQYSWSNGGNTAQITGLVAGDYTLTLKDGVDCPHTYTYIVTQPQSIYFNASTFQNEVSGNDGIISVSYSGGTANYNLEWQRTSPTTPAVIVSVSGLRTIDNPYFIKNLPVGTYSLTISDSKGCTKVSSATIGTASSLIINSIVTPVSCYGGSNGAIDLQVSGPAGTLTYNWHYNGLVTQDISNIPAGSYTVTVTHVELGFSQDKTIIVPEPPSALSVTGTITNVSCYGSTNGVIKITPVGGTPGYTFLWSGPSSFTASSQNITNLGSGNYSVTITDTKGCNVQANYTVTQPLPVAITLAPTNVSAFNGTNGQIVAMVTGGTAPYTYTWDNSMTTSTITGLVAGTYTLVVTDKNGCTASKSTTLTQPIDATSNCTYTIGDDFQTATYSGTGGSTINQNWATNWVEAGDDANPASGNIKIASVNCSTITNSQSLVIGNTSNSHINASISRTVDLSKFSSASLLFDDCISSTGNGSVVLYINDKVERIFTLGTTASETNYTVTILSADLILECSIKFGVVNSKNSCGIINFDKIRIVGAKAFKATAIPTTAICNGASNGSINVTIDPTDKGIPTYTYLWSNGSTVSPPLTGLLAGTYNVIVTDFGGCTVTLSNIVVTQPPQITATISKINPACPAASDGSISILSPSNGNGSGYQYRFTTLAGVQIQDWSIVNSITGQPSGTYVAYIKNFDGTCQTKLPNVVLTEIDAINPVISSPGNITQITNTSSCTANITIPGPTLLSDNCGVPSLTWTATGAKTGSGAGNVGTALNPLPIGTTTITYRATDASANFSTCSFTVTVTSDINLTGLSILASSVCQGSGTTALISGNLLDDSYTLGYSISGSNMGTYSTTLNVAGGTGGGSITIPKASLATIGTTTVTINSITSSTTSCVGNVAVSTNFVINPNLPVSISIAALPSGAICDGTSVTFTATPINAGATPGYQWKVNGSPVGTNGPTYTNSGLLNGNTVTCDLTKDPLQTCATGSPATSNAINMILYALPLPSFTSSPGGNACAQDDVTYTTQLGMSNYVWSGLGTQGIDYTITSGGIGTASNTVTLKWLTAASKTVTVNYKDTNGCTGTAATTTVIVNPLPVMGSFN